MNLNKFICDCHCITLINSQSTCDNSAKGCAHFKPYGIMFKWESVVNKVNLAVVSQKVDKEWTGPLFFTFLWDKEFKLINERVLKRVRIKCVILSKCIYVLYKVCQEGILLP